MEVVWLALATLLLLGIYIAYWRRRRRTPKSEVSQKLQPILWEYQPRAQSEEPKLDPLPKLPVPRTQLKRLNLDQSLNLPAPISQPKGLNLYP